MLYKRINWRPGQVNRPVHRERTAQFYLSPASFKPSACLAPYQSTKACSICRSLCFQIGLRYLIHNAISRSVVRAPKPKISAALKSIHARSGSTTSSRGSHDQFRIAQSQGIISAINRWRVAQREQDARHMAESHAICDASQEKRRQVTLRERGS